jgi:hypothetical protein
VARLRRDFTARGFEVWFDRNAMPSPRLTLQQEIQGEVAARERLVLIVGPKAAMSDYVRQEWQFALQADKAVMYMRRAALVCRLRAKSDRRGMTGAERGRESFSAAVI